MERLAPTTTRLSYLRQLEDTKKTMQDSLLRQKKEVKKEIAKEEVKEEVKEVIPESTHEQTLEVSPEPPRVTFDKQFVEDLNKPTESFLNTKLRCRTCDEIKNKVQSGLKENFGSSSGGFMAFGLVVYVIIVIVCLYFLYSLVKRWMDHKYSGRRLQDNDELF